MKKSMIELTEKEIKNVTGMGLIGDIGLFIINIAAPIVGFVLGVRLFLCLTKPAV